LPANAPALRFIGVGEQIDDLQVFRAREFVDALFTPIGGSTDTPD
jgi:fused signal recognition particle receptor